MEKLRKIITYTVLVLLVIAWLLPVFAIIMAALKSPQEFNSTSFFQFPTKIAFVENFQMAIKQWKLHEHFLNSFIYAISGGIIAIITASMAGFSIIRLRPRFNFPLFLIIYSGTLFPFQMYLIPLYRIFNNIGLYDSKIGMILVYSALCIPFSLFVYRGFYTTIPKEIEDAANIDGCNAFQLYLHIFLPQSVAPTAVVALFQMTWIWNDLLFGMVLTRTGNARPVMVSLASMSGVSGGIIPYIMSGVIFTSLPTIVLFILLRRYFISGMVLTAPGD
ncbi:MAG: carbohydrate ABC transporter permease [Actinomycetota bacterium]|nr:carbohydrate ABC transporter permease [Actinomycetota bacterium]